MAQKTKAGGEEYADPLSAERPASDREGVTARAASGPGAIEAGELTMGWKPVKDMNRKEIEVHVELLREALERLAARLSVHPLIVEDFNIRCGIPTLLGTRLAALEIAAEARVASYDEMLETYPTLTRELITAALEYERMAAPPGEPKREAL